MSRNGNDPRSESLARQGRRKREDAQIRSRVRVCYLSSLSVNWPALNTERLTYYMPQQASEERARAESSKLRKRSRYYLREWLNLPPCCHSSFPYITFFLTSNNPSKNSNDMLTCIALSLLSLCDFRMSHVMLILYNHTSMLTLRISLISHALWLTQL